MGVHLLAFLLRQIAVWKGGNPNSWVYHSWVRPWEMEKVAKGGDNGSKSDLFVWSWKGKAVGHSEYLCFPYWQMCSYVWVYWWPGILIILFHIANTWSRIHWLKFRNETLDLFLFCSSPDNFILPMVELLVKNINAYSDHCFWVRRVLKLWWRTGRQWCQEGFSKLIIFEICILQGRAQECWLL